MSHVTTAERPAAAPAPIANDAPAQLPRTVQPPLAGGGRILPIIPQNLAEVNQLAHLFARRRLVSDSYLTENGEVDVDMVCVAILAGLEVGLPPVQAVSGIVFLAGVPTIYGDARDALVAASGLLEDMKEDLVLDDAGIFTSATCTIWRKDRETPITQTVTRGQAELAGWLENDAWIEHPNRMAQMRARGWASRDAFPDVLKGVLKDREEQQDILDVTGRGSATTAPPGPKRSDFMPPKDAPAAATTEQQIEPVGDHPEEPEGWPLYDETGETVGTYPAVRWVDEFERMTSPMVDERWAVAVDNNRETAADVVEDCADKMDAIAAQGLSTSFAFAKAIAQKSMQAGGR